MKGMHYVLGCAWMMSAAGAAERDPVEVLKLVMAKVRARDAGLPNYTCVQTVERNYYKPRGSTLARSCPALMELRRHPTFDMVLLLRMTDRLRLDVTMSERGEIYSWVGASHFQDETIDQIVHEGPIGTGSFGGFLAVVFDKDVKAFHFEREVSVQGRGLMEYSFQVPKEKSSYTVKAGNSWVHMAYSGIFQVDPETNELVRMTVRTDDLPPVTGNCETTTGMEFALARIGDGEFLLPKQGRQRFVTVSGEEAENLTTFDNCREYRGESTVTFFAAPEPAGIKVTRGRAAGPVVLPAGLPFTFELTASIDADRAAAGDAFAGRLAGALRDEKGRTLAPSHAPVEGRLLRVQMIRTAPAGAVLVLKLRTVEIGGVKVPLEAVRDWPRMAIGKRGGMPIFLPLPWEQNSGVFQLAGEHAAMQAGLRTVWRTVGSAH